MEKLARVAYESYCNATGYKSLITGDDLPQWNCLPTAVKLAWIEVVAAVREAL